MMERDLGYRRIQRTGRGSYIISLPKVWIQDLELKRGNQLAFTEQDDSSLLLVPRKIMERKEKEDEHKLKKFRINVDSKDHPQSICRKIISLYVNNADVIRIFFKEGKISPDFRIAINNLNKNLLLGTEIIDETTNEITIQILINHPDFPVEKAIRRTAILAISANKEATSGLQKMDNKLKIDEKIVKSITETCNDVERLNLYVVRQLKYGLENNLFKDFEFRTPKEFLGYRIIISDLKSIARKASNLANDILSIKKMINENTLSLSTPIDEEILSQIMKFNSEAHYLFQEALKTLFKRDYKKADNLLFQMDSLNALENKLILLISTKKLDPNISSIFRIILDDSKRIIEYSQNIGEIALNRTVEDVAQPFEKLIFTK